MSVPSKTETQPKAALSVSSQCRLLKISRSQFYFHVKRGTFHAPLYLPSNNRPYYTASMVEDNLRARETGVGVNGEFVIWYERVPGVPKPEIKKSKVDPSALLEGLKASNLKTVTVQQIETALAACFPHGTSGQDENVVLQAVYRHLKRSGVE